MLDLGRIQSQIGGQRLFGWILAGFGSQKFTTSPWSRVKLKESLLVEKSPLYTCTRSANEAAKCIASGLISILQLVRGGASFPVPGTGMIRVWLTSILIIMKYLMDRLYTPS